MSVRKEVESISDYQNRQNLELLFMELRFPLSKRQELFFFSAKNIEIFYFSCEKKKQEISDIQIVKLHITNYIQ